jgi:hypothetical protein
MQLLNRGFIPYTFIYYWEKFTWRLSIEISPPRQTLSAVTTVDFPVPFGPTITLKFGPGQNEFI